MVGIYQYITKGWCIFLDEPLFLTTSAISLIISENIFFNDLRNRNQHLMPLMKWVWGLTVLYSGLVGLIIYFASGRMEIPKNNLWHKAFRPVSHCYCGCGAGKIAGIFMAAGLLSLGN